MLPAGWRRRYRGGLARERPLAPLTTWRIGGPAELYLEPADVEDLALVLDFCRRVGLPCRVLGGGSNLLVPDRGVRGAVVNLARLRGIRERDGVVEAEAGALLHAVVTFAARRGRAGLETLAGIPGRVGGAVFGNAGSRHGAIGDVVRSLDLMAPDGTLSTVVPDAGFFRYRGSAVGDRIVVRARLGTEAGDPAALQARIRELVRERQRTQPGWIGNAGCVFRNPPGESAGRLIDTARLKSERVGGIRVSETHANFFENDVPAGSEADVLRLVERVQDRVLAVHGVELALEVRRWR